MQNLTHGMEVLPAAERGHANHGWLDTNHTFSFANYYNPERMGFGPLRVINQDKVDGGAGFGWHPHRDMEIISYVLDGALAHKDTSGGMGMLRHGDVQVMTAGTGVYHTELNGSASEQVHFLQIWIMPKERGTQPRYADRTFSLDQRGKLLVASHDGRGNSLQIGQDADVYRVMLDDGETHSHTPAFERQWVQLIKGELQVGSKHLKPGDGIAVVGKDALELHASGDVEALLFDMVA